MKRICLALSTILFLAAARPAAAQIMQAYTRGADSVRIHYLEAGPADAERSILLIPGGLTSAYIWSAQLAYFSAHGYRVIAMDSRSQGGSTVVQSGNAPEDRARDIHAVVHALKLQHLTLVGWSQGVQDVAAYVDRYGTGALKRIVLVDATASAGPGDVRANPAFVEAVLQHMAMYSRNPGRYSDGFMHATIGAPAPATTFARLEAEFTRTPVDTGISMQMQDLFTADRRAALKKFDKPTLVVASGESPLLEAEKRMAATLPRGQFVIVRHAAHALFFDRPREFDRLLEDFIQGREVKEL